MSEHASTELADVGTGEEGERHVTLRTGNVLSPPHE
jgi:hypothetical protein